MTVTEPLTAWAIIFKASLPVQFVMITLVAMSVLSWMFIIRRGKELRLARKSQIAFEERFWSGVDLSRLYVQLSSQSGEVLQGQAQIFLAGFKEFARLRQSKTATDADAVMEGSQRSMRVALLREQEKLEKHLPFLATVGSVSPYIGLLGTVWGIMNSFLALATQNQATLQVVAPDIAEALIATAFGLFAAIPAVIAYNRYTTEGDSLMNMYVAFSDEFSSILHRKVHGEGLDG